MGRKKIEQTRLVGFGNSKPYKPMSAGALRLVQPPTMLIEDFIASGFVCGLTSYPGVGKTWLAMAVAESVCTGDPLMGQFKIVEPGGVLFIGSDSSEADYSQQWRRLTEKKHREWEGSFDPEHGEAPPSPFARVQFLIQSPFMLDNADEVRRIILTALDESLFPREQTVIDGEVVKSARGGCKLIVMDTLSRLTMANQNDNTEMEKVFAHIRIICEVTGAAVLILHHNSKATEFNDGADWRGAMSQIGALDSWIQLSSSKRNRHKIKAEFKKFRGITPGSFEYQQNVGDPEVANLAFLGKCEQLAVDTLHEDLLLQFSAWKTLADAEEAMWAAYSDQFTERGKFKKALQNRLGELVKQGKVDKRPAPRKDGQKGAPAQQYQIRRPDASPATPPVPGELPEN